MRFVPIIPDGPNVAFTKQHIEADVIAVLGVAAQVLLLNVRPGIIKG